MATAPVVASPDTSLPHPSAQAPSPTPSTTAETTEATRQPSPSRKRRRSEKSSTARTLQSPLTGATKATSPLGDRAQPLLTGAAALADEQRAREKQTQAEARQTSPNPARQAIEGMMSGGMSKIEDGPGASRASEPSTTAAPAVRLDATKGYGKESMETSPPTVTAAGESAEAPSTTIITNGVSTASPGRIEDAPGEDDDGSTQSGPSPTKAGGGNLDEPRTNKPSTYPAPLQGQPPPRSATLPAPGYGADEGRSPLTKRHKCPYCNTDFTRHHNLKSHLLTHSQEKPYSCDTCDSRFRRLHDLKRHTKLHTGERPHVCPKCDRSFARGDALARHTKGQGGCAGRRSSMGSFGGDDKNDGGRSGDGEGMSGIMYTGEASHEPEAMDEDMDGANGRSLPSIRKHDAPTESHSRSGSDYAGFAPRQPSTYPPVASRPPNSGGLYPPPNTSPRATATATSGPSQPAPYPPSMSSNFPSTGLNVFSQSGMTESPKPLSPGGAVPHQMGQSGPSPGPPRTRSPTLSEQYPHPPYNRRSTGGHISPPTGLPPPPPAVNHPSAPHLPPLQGLTPPEPRYTLGSQHMNGPNNVSGPSVGPSSPSYPPGNSSANNSLSSQGTGPQTSLDRAPHNYPQPTDRLWAYLQGLEAKVNRLEEEVASLRSQPGPAVQHR